MPRLWLARAYLTNYMHRSVCTHLSFYPRRGRQTYYTQLADYNYSHLRNERNFIFIISKLTLSIYRLRFHKLMLAMFRMGIL